MHTVGLTHIKIPESFTTILQNMPQGTHKLYIYLSSM